MAGYPIDLWCGLAMARCRGNEAESPSLASASALSKIPLQRLPPTHDGLLARHRRLRLGGGPGEAPPDRG